MTNFTIEVLNHATDKPHTGFVPYVHTQGPLSLKLQLSGDKTIEVKVITKSYVGECETVCSVSESFTIDGNLIRRDYCSEKQCRGDLSQTRRTSYSRIDSIHWVASPMAL